MDFPLETGPPSPALRVGTAGGKPPKAFIYPQKGDRSISSKKKKKRIVLCFKCNISIIYKIFNFNFILILYLNLNFNH
jgi:hypothetical protein